LKDLPLSEIQKGGDSSGRVQKDALRNDCGGVRRFFADVQNAYPYPSPVFLRERILYFAPEGSLLLNNAKKIP